MGFTLDYFVARMQCPHCKVMSAADNATNMITYIRKEPELACLGVGDPLEIDVAAMPERSYLSVQEPRAGEPIRILQWWECPSCGRINWAEICVDGGRIVEIAPVLLDREHFERAHFIHDEAKGVAAALMDRSFSDIAYEDVVSILRRLL